LHRYFTTACFECLCRAFCLRHVQQVCLCRFRRSAAPDCEQSHHVLDCACNKAQLQRFRTKQEGKYNNIRCAAAIIKSMESMYLCMLQAILHSFISLNLTAAASCIHCRWYATASCVHLQSYLDDVLLPVHCHLPHRTFQLAAQLAVHALASSPVSLQRTCLPTD